MASSASVSGTSARKNAPGNRTDPGWEHGMEVDGNSRKVKCKYCGLVCSGGVFRFKHHLAQTSKNVGPCTQVPEDVRNKFLSLLQAHSGESATKRQSMFLVDEEGETQANIGSSKEGRQGTLDGFAMKKAKMGYTLNMSKDEERENVCQQICRFFYTSGIPLSCVNNPEFSKMIEMIGQYGRGLMLPSFHEAREIYLQKELDDILILLEEHKKGWKKSGCTIVCDEWSDRSEWSICNFSVNSHRGTIFISSIDTSEISKSADKVFEMLDDAVEKVGEENVVQVVTKNVANYKLAGEKLMEKRKKLFWTPCAAHCIDLMLEDFEKKIKEHKVALARGRKITCYIYSRAALISWLKEFNEGKDLVRPAATRYATAYLTLSRLHEQKSALISLFSSTNWRSSRFAKSVQGKKIEAVVMNTSGFWALVLMSLKAAVPLLKVLRMVDSDDKPGIGFIYDAMGRAMEEIKSNFNNVQSRYGPIFEIINDRWENQLHSPLHAAAYFLNPQMHYSPSFKPDVKVKLGLYTCIQRMCVDNDERSKVDGQFDEFKNATDLFGFQIAVNTRDKKNPADWWDSFGDSAPELKKFAVRVLSLTCSSFGCERNRGAFEMVHSKRRNLLHQQKMNDLAFVMYNLKLRERYLKRECTDLEKLQRMCPVDLESDDEWITEKVAPVLPTARGWTNNMLDRAARLQANNDAGDGNFLEKTVKPETGVDLDQENANAVTDNATSGSNELEMSDTYNDEILAGGEEDEDLHLEDEDFELEAENIDDDLDLNAHFEKLV